MCARGPGYRVGRPLSCQVMLRVVERRRYMKVRVAVINFAELAEAERLDLFSPTETREAAWVFKGSHCALLFGEPPCC